LSGEHVIQTRARTGFQFAYPAEHIPEHLRTSQESVRIITRAGQVFAASSPQRIGGVSPNPRINTRQALAQMLDNIMLSQAIENSFATFTVETTPSENVDAENPLSLSHLTEKFPKLATTEGAVLNLRPDEAFTDVIADGEFSIDSSDIHDHIYTILASDTPRERSSGEVYHYSQPGGFGTQALIHEGSTAGDRGAPRELPVHLRIQNGKLDIHHSINIDALARTLDPEYDRITRSRASGEGWQPEALEFSNRNKYVEEMEIRRTQLNPLTREGQIHAAGERVRERGNQSTSRLGR
jgi:hypothetical protein